MNISEQHMAALQSILLNLKMLLAEAGVCLKNLPLSATLKNAFIEVRSSPQYFYHTYHQYPLKDLIPLNALSAENKRFFPDGYVDQQLLSETTHIGSFFDILSQSLAAGWSRETFDFCMKSEATLERLHDYPQPEFCQRLTEQLIIHHRLYCQQLYDQPPQTDSSSRESVKHMRSILLRNVFEQLHNPSSTLVMNDNLATLTEALPSSDSPTSVATNLCSNATHHATVNKRGLSEIDPLTGHCSAMSSSASIHSRKRAKTHLEMCELPHNMI